MRNIEQAMKDLETEIEVDELIVGDLKTWFDEYCNAFPAQDTDLKRNISLKREHTMKVCEEIVAVGKELGLEEKALSLAEIIALFHDVGRFEQYLQYRTFVDGKSVNHAEFGVKILREKHVLAGLAPQTRELVLSVIACHNRAQISDIEDPVRLFFARLLRDADKLDIYRVVTDYYRECNGNKNTAIELGLPDAPEISHEVFRNLMARRVIRHEQLKTLNDFKLLQLAWVFDINFIPALRRVCDRGYLEIIHGSLPDVQETREIFSMIKAYLGRRMQGAIVGDQCR